VAAVRFRLTTMTIAVFPDDENCGVARLPLGAIISVDDTLLANKMIEVTFEGRKVLMFAQDIRTQGERVEE